MLVCPATLRVVKSDRQLIAGDQPSNGQRLWLSMCTVVSVNSQLSGFQTSTL